MAERVFGIDVSKWQENFDFAGAKNEGVRFAVLRAAYSAPGVINGGGQDTAFSRHYERAVAEGLPVGVYQYSMAKTPEEAVSEARFLVESCLAGKSLSLPVFIDAEDKSQLALSPRALTDTVKAWCDYIEKSGYFVGVYSSKSNFDTHMIDSELTRYTHWVAQWAKSCTYQPEGSLGMWQFGGERNLLRTNKVAGVVCDQNYMLADYPALIKKAGLNGFAAQKQAGFDGRCSGTNIHRAKDTLVQYIGIEASGTNEFGYEVPVDKNGVVLSNPVYGQGNMKIPDGGRVLSAHGIAGEWLHENVRAGYTLWVDESVHVYMGKRRSIDAVNYPRGENMLILYRSPVTVPPTNRYGYEVPVGADGIASSVPVYGKGKTPVPSGGFVLSAHGTAGTWLAENIRSGNRITVENDKIISVS